MVTRSKGPVKKPQKLKAAVKSRASVKTRAPAKSQTKVKTVAKTSIKRTLAKKSPTTHKKPDRDTLVKLRAYVDDIEKRLKRANALTRTSVRALKTSYEALDGDNQASALTGHIEELSDRLTGMIEQTRLDVAHDLKVVLTDPRLDTLSGALTKANQRLTAAEQNQAEAINAINVNIARLATAVDERMQREERQREKGDTILAERMDVIEQDSAEAIKLIGDKVVSISEELTDKSQTFRGELAEQALTRQQDYEEHKHDMARRIEAIEDEQRNQLPSFERGIANLTTRLETLETMRAETFASPVEAEQFAPNYEAAPQMQGEETVAAPYTDVQQDDAFAALELVDMQEVAPVVQMAPATEYPSEYVQEHPPMVVAEQTQAGQAYAPVEYAANVVGMNGAMDGQNPEVFSPRAYAPGNEAVMQAAPPPVLVTDNSPEVYNPATASAPPPMPSEQGVYNQTPPPPMPSEPMPLENAVPEIQTLEQTMESARPGGDPNAKIGKGKKGKKKRVRKEKNGSGSGGNGHGMIRKAALFGGVAVVALFAYKAVAPKIFGSKPNTPISAQTTQDRSPVTVKVDAWPDGAPKDYTTADGQTFETVEPVGDYSEGMAAPNFGDSPSETGARNAQQQTLEAAAAAGNPIAQFQLGLSHLEAGRDADAVRLVRLAANQGEPAAQYRLAKLYEAGIGVKVNGKTAKDLLSRSAKSGNRIAMHDLGHYYATGADGSAPDLQQAVKWFSMAADRGVLDSQFNLAVLYQGGTGVPRSLEDAYVWYAIAGSQGDKIALQRSEAVARDLSPEGLKSARARVKAYAPKSVNNAANGVFKNLTWVSDKEAKASSTPVPSVKTAQKMLASLGYNVGTPDGAMGPNTRNAILSFERANGLPETGRVNGALIERLQLAAGV